MKTFIGYVGTLALAQMLLCGAANSQEAKTQEPTSAEEFQLASLNITTNSVEVGEWDSNSSLFGTTPVEVVTAGSWCPPSLELLRNIEKEPEYAHVAKYVFIFDTDAQTAIDVALKDKEISSAKAVRYKERISANNILIFAPDELQKLKFTYYLVHESEVVPVL